MKRFQITFIIYVLFLFGQTSFAKAEQNRQIFEKKQVFLYYTNWCPYSRKVLNFLKHEHIDICLIDIQENQNAKQELLQIGKKAIVPCLILNHKLAIYGSDEIIEWLKTHEIIG